MIRSWKILTKNKISWVGTHKFLTENQNFWCVGTGAWSWRVIMRNHENGLLTDFNDIKVTFGHAWALFGHFQKKFSKSKIFWKMKNGPFRRPCISRTRCAMMPFLHSLSRESSELLNEANRHEIGWNLAENEPRLKCDFGLSTPSKGRFFEN